MLCEKGRFPTRRTFERRLKALPERLPAQIGCLGRYLVGLLNPWERAGRAVAVDSTLLRARGGVWHKKDKEAGRGASHFHRHRCRLDQIGLARVGVWVEALDLAISVAGMWIPLSARLTPAEVADNQMAPALIEELPDEARFVLGDTHYNAENVREKCEQRSDFWSLPNVEPTRTPTRGWR